MDTLVIFGMCCVDTSRGIDRYTLHIYVIEKKNNINPTNRRSEEINFLEKKKKTSTFAKIVVISACGVHSVCSPS